MSNELRKEFIHTGIVIVLFVFAFCAFALFNYFITEQGRQAEVRRRQQVLKEATELLKKN
jgi:hypothetical protein